MWYLIVSIPDLCNLTYFEIITIMARWICLVLYVSVNAYGHVETLKTLFLGELDYAVNQHFMHILSFVTVTDNNPFWRRMNVDII